MLKDRSQVVTVNKCVVRERASVKLQLELLIKTLYIFYQVFHII